MSSATAQLIGYGLLLGGAMVVGKLMIDGLVGDVHAAKERNAFIGPIQQKPMESGKVKLSDVVKFGVMCVSIYSTLADLPTLVSEWGQVQANVKSIVGQ